MSVSLPGICEELGNLPRGQRIRAAASDYASWTVKRQHF